MSTLSTRIPDELKKGVERLAKQRGQTVSEFVKEVLQKEIRTDVHQRLQSSVDDVKQELNQIERVILEKLVSLGSKIEDLGTRDETNPANNYKPADKEEEVPF